MGYIFRVLGAVLSKIFDSAFSHYIEELFKKHKKEFTAVVGVLVVLFLVVMVCHHIDNQKLDKEVDQVFLSTCKEHFNNQEYAHVLELIREDQFESAESCMVYAYCLAYGYGVDQNIPLSIEYYKKANDKGAADAISNMVVSVVKNCHTEVKIDAVKYAFDSGNEMAVKYVDYVVSSWNAKSAAPNGKITSAEIWSLEKNLLLEIMNGPHYRWVCSNKTYTTSVSTSSTPSFTRRFLYQIGTDRVYEECYLVGSNDFPSWLNENIW